MRTVSGDTIMKDKNMIRQTIRKAAVLFLTFVMVSAATGCTQKTADQEPTGEPFAKLVYQACNDLKLFGGEQILIAERELADVEKSVPLEEAELIAPEPTGTGEIWTEEVYLDPGWTNAGFSMINSGCAILYHTGAVPNGITVGVNAGHGTSGGTSVKTQCHPDGTPKVTGGTTAAGSISAVAVSSGMTFYDGTPESAVTLAEARFLRDKLLEQGYDVLMIRDGDDVQLDNVARTVICNNRADCHIAIHWDGDGLDYDKGAFFLRVPDGIKYMEPVASTWQADDQLGECLIAGLSNNGIGLNGNGSSPMDLTQTSYSSVASVDIELGNAASDHSDARLDQLAQGLLMGINMFFGL